MNRRNVITISVLAYLIVAFLPVWAHTQERESEHMQGTLQVVRVGAADLVPRNFSIKADEIVAWANYSGAPLRISFNKETVEKILCKEPTQFSAAEDGSLISGEIRPSEFATLCHFMPGEYDYTVHREFSPSSPRGGTRQSAGHISVTK